MKGKKMVIFDYDGVIADSWWLSHQIAIKVYPELTEEMHRMGFEGNIHESTKTWNHLEKTDVDFQAEYAKEMHLVHYFEEMVGVISELFKKYDLSIVSSSPSQQIRTYLKRENIEECFLEIFGSDVHIKKSEKIKLLFAKFGLTHADCIMVTDTSGDIKEARQVGVESIAVDWGFHHSKTLQAENPFKLISKPSDIQPAIEDYFSI